MKGIILAGGTGSRLYPLTKVTNKHLLPIGKKPMIFHPIEKLTEAGITDILIVTGVDHMGDVVSLLGSGKTLGCSLTYRVQEKSGGIAEALGLAETFANHGDIAVILGDNIFEDSLKPMATAFKRQKGGARLLLKEVSDPTRFGVPTLQADKILKITEKPAKPASSYAVTGIYFYDTQVFEFIKKCNPSKRGELEITDVNNFYVKKKACHYDILKGWWTDAGTFSSYWHANALVEKRRKTPKKG